MKAFPRAIVCVAAAFLPLQGAFSGEVFGPFSGPALAEERGPVPIPAAPEHPSFEIPPETRARIERLLDLIGPMLDSFSAMIDGLPRYDAPEILPNGDIIIRRKRPGPPAQPPQPDDGGPIKT